jgi:hypothetical protein
MHTIFQVLFWWTLLSCILAPLFTWAFFRYEREDQDGRPIEATSEGKTYRWSHLRA